MNLLNLLGGSFLFLNILEFLFPVGYGVIYEMAFIPWLAAFILEDFPFINLIFFSIFGFFRG